MTTEEILERLSSQTEMWYDAIQNEYRRRFSTEDPAELSVLEMLQKLMDDAFPRPYAHDDLLRLHLKRENPRLDTPFLIDDLDKLPASLQDAFRLCEEVNTILPRVGERIPFEKIGVENYDFASRSEIAVVNPINGMDLNAVEVQVCGPMKGLPEEEIIYWIKDKLYIIQFVERFDKAHAIALKVDGAIYQI